LDAPAGQEGIDIDDKRVGPLALECRESRCDLATGAGVEKS
jgi:hypothetical protein